MMRMLDNLLALVFIGFVFWLGMHAQTWLSQASTLVGCFQ